MAWLLYGQRTDGELLHISEAQRGDACDCFCPHCQTPLAAKKGNVKVHHFAHLGPTCAYLSVYDFLHVEQPLNTTLSLSEWAIWKQNDINETGARLHRKMEQYRSEMAQLLTDIQTGRDELEMISQVAHGRKERSKQRQINFDVLQKWDAFLSDHNMDRHELVLSLGTVRDLESCAYESIRFQRQNRYDGSYYARDNAWPSELWWPENKVHGWTPVWLIGPALRLVNEYSSLRRNLATTELHTEVFQAELSRFERFHLYLLAIEFDSRAPLFKVGITSRSDLTERIAEIRFNLRAYGVRQVTKLYELSGHAYLESYFKNKYALQQVRLGKLTEYFGFDDAQFEVIQVELDKLCSVPKPVTTDRKSRIRLGMNRAKERGVHVGRPSGMEPDQLFLAKPKSRQVLALLEQHPDWSMRMIAGHSGIALNTVCKVNQLRTKTAQLKQV